MPTKKSNNKRGSLCSGYGVFPSGKKCKGCIDCDFKPVSLKQAIASFDKNHSLLKVGAKKINVIKK